MTRTTVDYGIDLGTTNSSIAVLDGVAADVVRNNDNLESTPSVVHIDKAGNLIVGRGAYERLVSDPENTVSEFKREMGTDHKHTFERTGQEVGPIDLSAEVLKSLKSDVQQRRGEDLQAAVISVPAAFELPQCEATRQAADRAGLVISPLVQEPVAAAMAYGFQDESDRVFWLVYDLGGGTFDAAVIQVREGLIQVVNHGGDNHLGGKDLDWAIVEDILIPAVLREHELDDFRRGNPRWQLAIAKLKLHAEKAKIRLSRDEEVHDWIDNLFQDSAGAAVSFEYTIRREQVEQLMEPLVARSIDISKRVLKERRLGPGDIEKVILVGGPTLTPYLRERLADKDVGLGIPLEFRVDPLTVVAQGAAIFAGTQTVEGLPRPKAAPGAFSVQLEYKPVGPDSEPLVGGRVVHPNHEDLAGYSIEFINRSAKPAPWRSGRISLDADGTFVTELSATRGTRNTFEIELFDPEGSAMQVEPSELTYTVGQVITDPPLTNSVGVALANNEVKWLLEKGTPLPAEKRNILLRTAIDVKRGSNESVIRIPFIEGSSPRANRNSPIGYLEIPPEMYTRDIPAGAEVEVTIKIDRDRIVHSHAYVPIIDAEQEQVHKLEIQRPDPQHLRDALRREKDRLAEVKQKQQELDNPEASTALREIEAQESIEEVENSLDAGSDDRDALQRAEHRLRDLRLQIDRAEDTLALPAMISQVRQELESTKTLVDRYGDESERQQLSSIISRTEDAIENEDTERLRALVGDLVSLKGAILVKQPEFWIAYLASLEERRSSMHDPALAAELFERARRAIRDNDLPALQAIIRQLNSLLPPERQISQEDVFGSTVI